MCIITVFDDDYSSGREFAETLASRLGFRLADAGVLVERTAAWGGNREKLHRTCEQAPHFVDRFVRSKDIQVQQLRAALAKDIREGNVVCYGLAADLLNVRARQIVRVRIKASYESRLLLVQQRMGLNPAKARKYLDQGERRRERWRTYLRGTRATTPYGPGLLINLDETGIDQACATVRDMIECQARFQPTNADLGLIEKWALCAAIRAAVAQNPDTRHLDIEVATGGDAVVLSAIPPASDGGTFPLRFPASMSRSIQAALAQHPETRELNPDVIIKGDTVVLRGIVHGTNEIIGLQPVPANSEAGSSRFQVGVSDHESAFFLGQRPIERLGRRMRLLAGGRLLLRPAAAAAVAAALVVSALIYGTLSSRKNSQRSNGAPLQSFLGVISDSICGALHKGSLPSANCVRSCVQSNGAKYALREDGHIFVISNQQAAERFAAQRVMVAGVLDGRTRELHITTIRMARP